MAILENALPKNIQQYIDQIEKIKNFSPDEQMDSFAEIYSELEKYLIEESGGKITSEILKEKVRQKFDLHETESALAVLFLKPGQQKIELFKFLIRLLIQSLTPTFGTNSVQDIMNRVTQGVMINESGIDFTNFKDNKLENIIKQLFTEIKNLVGTEKSNQIFTDAYDKMQQTYGSLPQWKEMEAFFDIKDLSLGKAIIPVTKEAQKTFANLGLQKFIKTGTIRDLPAQAVDKNKKEIPVSLTGTTLKDKQGVIQGMIMVAKDLREIKKYATERLAKLTPVLQKASMGDFSEEVEIPEKEDEFTEHMVALNLMIDDLKEAEGVRAEAEKAKIAAATAKERAEKEVAEKMSKELEGKVQKRTTELDASNQQLEAANQQLKSANQQVESAYQQLEASQKQLQDKIVELERFNKITMGRETRILELKEEVAGLNNKNQEMNKKNNEKSNNEKSSEKLT